MLTELIDEARRQAEICNACRYCEGYCSVFPAMHQQRAFSDGDLTQLANLCHNCRNCYHACQYTAPHEFDLNLPQALAELRRGTWQEYAWPRPVAKLFHKSGMAVMLSLVVSLTLIFGAIRMIGSVDGGEGFYAELSHNAMVAIFLPAFLLPLVSLAFSLRRYWRATGDGSLRRSHLRGAFDSAARMKNLAGGHGDGCNYEDEDRFSQSRRVAHQFVMYGFLLCFASTSSATLMHYLLDMPAPYGPFSLPKLLGVPGGIMMTIGTIWLAKLKLKADKHLGDADAWGGEMAFIVLLFLVATTGLALYWLGSTALMPALLAVHLATVLSFFVLTPYTKMAHGFYRLAALVREQTAKKS